VGEGGEEERRELDAASESESMLQIIARMEEQFVSHNEKCDEKIRSLVSRTKKDLERLGKLLEHFPYDGIIKNVRHVLSKFLGCVLSVEANRKLSLYVANRIFILHCSSIKLAVISLKRE